MEKPVVYFTAHVLFGVQDPNSACVHVEADYSLPSDFMKMFVLILEAKPELAPILKTAILAYEAGLGKAMGVTVKDHTEPENGRTFQEN